MVRYTLRQGWRLRLAWIAGGGALLIFGGSRWLQHFNFGAAEVKFILDFGLGAIGLLAVLGAVIISAQLFFDDLETGAVTCIVTRSIRRWEYVIGKWLGIAVILAWWVGIMTLLLALILVWRMPAPDRNGFLFASLFQAGGLLWLKATVVAAMTLFVATYANSALFASGAGLLLALVAQLRPFTRTTGAWSILRFWPDLGVFDLDGIAEGSRRLEGAELAQVGSYWLLCVVLLGTVSASVFMRREF